MMICFNIVAISSEVLHKCIANKMHVQRFRVRTLFMPYLIEIHLNTPNHTVCYPPS